MCSFKERKACSVLLSAVLLTAGAFASPGAAHASMTAELATCTGGEAPGNAASFSPAISANGRYIAYHSNASNLVNNDRNGVGDVFVRDGRVCRTALTSIGSGAVQGNNFSDAPSISADGRYVAFASVAANLVNRDTNAASDIFVRDRKRGTTTRVSISSSGTQANGPSYRPAISADVRYVVFSSRASNLVPGDTNGTGDVFLRDLRRGTTERVSVSTTGLQADGNSAGLDFQVAADTTGRYVVFGSEASNLVAGDTNGARDVFVRDRKRRTTQRVNVSSDGSQADGGTSGTPAMSANGRFVSFSSSAANLVSGDTNGAFDMFVRDLVYGRTERVSVSSGGAQSNNTSVGDGQAMSANGRYVTFLSAASNLVPGDSNDQFDIFVRDRQRRVTQRVSVSTAGAQTDDYSVNEAISANGRYVVFASLASTLIPGDTNRDYDVYVRDRRLGTTKLVSAAA
ncbi:PD40 domain-containing protein [Krasilnikovia sp. M28-CT-15]